MISVTLLQITVSAVSLILPLCKIFSLPHTFISQSKDYSINRVEKQIGIPTEFYTNGERQIRVPYLVFNCCTYFLVCFNFGLKRLKPICLHLI